MTKVMILRCAHCRTRFAADDAHKGKTFRCRVCASPIKAEAANLADGGKAESLVPFAPTMLAAAPAPSAAPVAPTKASVAPATVTPATAARRNERSKRDLFGGQVELSSKVIEHHESAFTAARNENSVLFSLDQLSKPQVRSNDVVFSTKTLSSGSSASPGQLAGEAKKEDSGLIDLNRMMNDEKLSAKSVRPAPISEAPLGYVREVLDTPAPTSGIANPFAKKKRTGLIAALAAAAVFAFVGIGVLANSHEDARVKAAAAVAAPPPPVAVVAAPEPPPAPTTIAAKAPEAMSDDKAEAKSSGGRSSGKARRGAAKSGGATKSASSVPAAPAVSKKAADPCGCHGNLLCNMKCTAH